MAAAWVGWDGHSSCGGKQRSHQRAAAVLAAIQWWRPLHAAVPRLQLASRGEWLVDQHPRRRIRWAALALAAAALRAAGGGGLDVVTDDWLCVVLPESATAALGLNLAETRCQLVSGVRGRHRRLPTQPPASGMRVKGTVCRLPPASYSGCAPGSSTRQIFSSGELYDTTHAMYNKRVMKVGSTKGG